MRVREASGRAPGGSPGTFSERFGGFEKVLRGFWRFLKGLEWFYEVWIWEVALGFFEDLRVQEGSGRAPGRSTGSFSNVFCGFGKVLGGFGSSERVWSGIRRFSEGCRRLLEVFRKVRVGDESLGVGGFQAP